MKIALAIDHFYPNKGGAEKSLLEILTALHERGHSLQLCAMSWQTPLPLPMEFHRVRAAKFPRWRRNLSFAKNVSALLKQLRPDLVLGVRHVVEADIFLARGGLYRETLKSNLQARPSKLKAFEYRYSPKHRVLLDLERQLFTNAHPPLVIAPSHFIKGHVLQNFPLDPNRVLVVPNGTDLEKFRPADPAKRKQLRSALGIGDELVVLFAAHNFRLKGLQYLLKAWSSLDTKQFRLLVAGRDRVPAGAANFSNVTFLGHHENPLELYQAADILVHPTFHDTFGRVILEALACGLPVVTTRFAGAAELMTNGREGFVLDDPGNISELAQRINCFRDPDLLRSFSKAARLCAEQFPKSTYLEKTVAAIEAEGRRKSGS